MKKLTSLLLLLAVIYNADGMDGAKSWLQGTLALFNLHTPHNVLEQHCLEQKDNLVDLLQQDREYVRSLRSKTDDQVALTADGKTASDVLTEMNAASAEQARLLRKQGRINKYRKGLGSVIQITIGGTCIAINLGVILDSDDSKNDKIRDGFIQNIAPGYLILQGLWGIADFFRGTDGKVLEQTIRAGNAQSALFALALKNQETLIKQSLQQQSENNFAALDNKLANMEQQPGVNTPSVKNAMAELSARSRINQAADASSGPAASAAAAAAALARGDSTSATAGSFKESDSSESDNV